MYYNVSLLSFLANGNIESLNYEGANRRLYFKRNAGYVTHLNSCCEPQTAIEGTLSHGEYRMVVSKHEKIPKNGDLFRGKTDDAIFGVFVVEYLSAFTSKTESNQIPFNISREPFTPGEYVPYSTVINPVRRVQIIMSCR